MALTVLRSSLVPRPSRAIYQEGLGTRLAKEGEVRLKIGVGMNKRRCEKKRWERLDMQGDGMRKVRNNDMRGDRVMSAAVSGSGWDSYHCLGCWSVHAVEWANYDSIHYFPPSQLFTHSDLSRIPGHLVLIGPRVSETRPEEKRRGVVYEVPCRDCNSVYVGETGRSLEIEGFRKTIGQLTVLFTLWSVN